METTTTRYEITYTADCEGDWCQQSAGRRYATREEALVALAADPTAGPDVYGNRCYPEVVAVEVDEYTAEPR